MNLPTIHRRCSRSAQAIGATLMLTAALIGCSRPAFETPAPSESPIGLAALPTQLNR